MKKKGLECHLLTVKFIHSVSWLQLNVETIINYALTEALKVPFHTLLFYFTFRTTLQQS